MILTLKEAKELLKVDYDDSDILIQELIQTIPQYLLETTGNSWDTQPIHPIVKTTAGFILMLWFEPTDRNNERLHKVINSLLTLLMAMNDGEQQ